MRLVLDVPKQFIGEVGLGDSIALNGCCLTVVEINGGTCAFQAGTETLSKTNLGDLRPGSQVNVERAIAVGARLGGHFVQGHIDGTGRVDAIDQDGEWTTMWFKVPQPLTQQMVRKGSITVDGISLTLVEVEPERFSVALIPHTLAVTSLGQCKVGDTVNIETDILGKYVQKLVGEIGC
jgi:riboflavin synthase